MPMIRKTVVTRQAGVYSAFPTFTRWEDEVFVFYRQARASRAQAHGRRGTVKCWSVGADELTRLLRDPQVQDLYAYGRDTVVFAGENEIDSIVSRLGENLYVLCTRIYIPDVPARSFVSVAERPVFGRRREVAVTGVDWLVFYGKALAWDRGYVFTAYGGLAGEGGSRPLVLYTEDLASFRLLSHISPPQPDVILNENSLVFDGKEYVMFIRQDTPPFGIWSARSADLVRWSEPVKLFAGAQAPMAFVRDGEAGLTFRDLSLAEGTALSLLSPLTGREKTVLDFYPGSPYDGGYSDPGNLAGGLAVFYYCGNEAGEPEIKVALPGEGDGCP